MSASSASSSRSRLLLLAVAAILVTGILWFGYTYREMRSLTLQSHQEEVLRFAHIIAQDFERVVDETRGLLLGLGEVEVIREVDRPGCDLFLTGVLERHPRYTAAGVVYPDGYRVCGALPTEDPLYLGDRSYIRRGEATGRFSMGDYQVGRITGKPTVGFAYPLFGEGGEEDEVRGFLAITLDLGVLAEHASEAQLPPGSSLTVFDQGGTILVRYPEGLERIGDPLPEDFPRPESAADAPVLQEGSDLDGTTRQFALTGLQVGGQASEAFLAVGVTQDRVRSELRQILHTSLILLAGMAALLLTLAWILGRAPVSGRDPT